jgi:hypothetical protein
MNNNEPTMYRFVEVDPNEEISPDKPRRGKIAYGHLAMLLDVAERELEDARAFYVDGPVGDPLWDAAIGENVRDWHRIASHIACALAGEHVQHEEISFGADEVSRDYRRRHREI